jgi:pimeloyl-ACP methyl ester carboxylesterase
VKRLHISIPLLALLLLGCNVVKRQRESYEAIFREAALEPHDVQLGDESVHYWDGGQGTPLVLVHGFGADAIWQWHPQIRPLAAKHRVVVPDLLWFGQSSSRAAADRFLIAHQAQMLQDLLSQLKIAQADLVGISYGGLVAYELARRHPARIRRLVMVDSPGRAYTVADYRALCQRFSVGDIGRVFVPDDTQGVRRLLELAYHDPPWMPEFAAHQVLRDLYGPGRREKLRLIDGLLQELRAAPEAPRPPLPPTLIIWGLEDPVFPVELGRRLARHIGPGAKLHVIPRARHAPNLEHPDEFNRVLLGFL